MKNNKKLLKIIKKLGKKLPNFLFYFLTPNILINKISL